MRAIPFSLRSNACVKVFMYTLLCVLVQKFDRNSVCTLLCVCVCVCECARVLSCMSVVYWCVYVVCYACARLRAFVYQCVMLCVSACMRFIA